MEQGIKKEPLGKGFYINVSQNHTFGTDAILLANFSNAKKSDTMLDLGTGCGIIPILMLRDGNLKKAVGVDISDEAIALANITKDELNLPRFTLINSDLNDLKGKTDFGCYTLVTCNPPYKAPKAGIKNPNERLRVARHEVACTLSDVIRVASKLLQTSGRFCICQRPERTAELLALLREYKLEPKRMRFVAQSVGREPWLVMVEAKKCANTGMRISPTLYIENNGKLSDEMIEIYGIYKEAYL